MQLIRYEHQGKRVTLYPLVCWHLGEKQADERFIKEHVQRIAADPNGKWVYLGDGGACVTKVSVGDLYEQTMNPDEQLDMFVELAEPIRGKGLFGLSGNHDRRISKLSGLDWTHQLCARLGIPYLGISAFALIVLHPGKSNAATSFETFWHHGVDSSSLLGGKIRSAQKLEQLVRADAIFSAHSHVCMDLPPEYVAYIEQHRSPTVGYRELRQFICGCAYNSLVPGYAEEKGYRPILPAHLGVTLEVSNNHEKRAHNQRRISCEIWRGAP
jgi:hypothetical protein